MTDDHLSDLVDELRNFQELATTLKPSPGEIPVLPGVEIGGTSTPLKELVGGDHDASAGDAFLLQDGDHPRHRLRVHRGERFVEPEKVAIAEEGSTEGEPVALALAEIQPSIGEGGVESAPPLDRLALLWSRHRSRVGTRCRSCANCPRGG